MHVKTLSLTALMLCFPGLAFAQTTPATAPATPSETTVAPATPTAGAETQSAVALQSQALEPTAPVAEPAATAGAPEDADKKKETLSKSLAVSKEGFFQPGGLIQAWFFMNHKDHTTSTFRLRRAELTAKGEILPGTFGYRITVDAAKLLALDSKNAPVTDENGDAIGQVAVPAAPADGSILQDVYINWMSEYVDASIGQFKIPVSWEGYNSSSKLLFPERSLVSRKFGDKRDIGVRLEKKFKHVGYTAGVYNGQGQNHLDGNNQKDIALRLEGYPIDGVMLGAVGYTSVGGRSLAAKDRFEVDARAQLGKALFQAEYIYGVDGASANRIKAEGFYAALGYTLFDRLQPVVRVGLLDPNIDADTDSADRNETAHYEFGANYYVIDNDLKFQANLGFFDPSTSGEKTLTEFTFAAQLGF